MNRNLIKQIIFKTLHSFSCLLFLNLVMKDFFFFLSLLSVFFFVCVEMCLDMYAVYDVNRLISPFTGP